MDWLASATDILQPISIIVASLVAIWGVSAWRREHVGRKRIDLAEEILRAFYEVQDAIRSVRSPFGFGGEGSTRKRGAKETPDETQVLDNAYVAIERYNKHSELFARLWALRYRAKVLLGTGAIQPFDDINRVANEIIMAARRLADYWRRQGHGPYPEGFDKHLEEMHKWESIFWETPDNDPLKPRIDAAITAVELVCKPVIEQSSGPARGWKWMRRRRLGIGITTFVAIVLAFAGSYWRHGDFRFGREPPPALNGYGTWCFVSLFGRQGLDCRYYSEQHCVELALIEVDSDDFCVPRPRVIR